MEIDFEVHQWLKGEHESSIWISQQEHKKAQEKEKEGLIKEWEEQKYE